MMTNREGEKALLVKLVWTCEQTVPTWIKPQPTNIIKTRMISDDSHYFLRFEEEEKIGILQKFQFTLFVGVRYLLEVWDECECDQTCYYVRYIFIWEINRVQLFCVRECLRSFKWIQNGSYREKIVNLIVKQWHIKYDFFWRVKRDVRTLISS